MTLKRDLKNKVIGGVCSGLGKHFGVDPTLVRLGFVGSFLFFGVGPLVYLLMWIIIPAETEENNN